MDTDITVYSETDILSFLHLKLLHFFIYSTVNIIAVGIDLNRFSNEELQ